MTIYSKGINGVASSDAGAEAFSISSTEEEPKTVLRVVITSIALHPILLNVTLERETIAENIPLEVVAHLMPERVIELNVAIPVGQTLKGILTPQSSGSDGTLDGWVEYEIAK